MLVAQSRTRVHWRAALSAREHARQTALTWRRRAATSSRKYLLRPGGHSAKNARRVGFPAHFEVIEEIIMIQGNSYMTTVHYGRSDGHAGGWGGSAGGAGLVVDRNWRDRAACRSE